MTYIVSKRKGVWTVGAGGMLMNFDDYCSAIETARGAAKVLEDVATKSRSSGGPQDAHPRTGAPASRIDLF